MKKGKRRGHAGISPQALDGAFEKTAVTVSAVSIGANVLLSLFKALAGILAHSGAMISDAVHSMSDVLSSIIVIIGIKAASRGSDREHPYGHERFECVAAIVLAVILFVTGLFIGHAAVEKLSADQQELAVPGVLALCAAAVSIVCKEGMYWYTRHYAKRLDSGALMADAWHHRSDALSSIGALIGIGGARLGFVKLEAVASIVICLFILKAAYDIFKDAVDKMVDASCSEETERKIVECARRQKDVLGVDLIHTRVFGSKVYVDIEIRADGKKTLTAGHETAQRVHDAIETEFPKVKHIMVHVNPDGEEG